MLHYLTARLIQGAFVLWGVSLFSFGLLFVSGDPAMSLIGAESGWTRQQVEAFRELRGFDKPWYEQYFHFMRNAIVGNFGLSFRYQQPPVELLLDKLPATAALAGTAMVLATVVGVLTGVISAAKQGTAIDRLVLFAAIAVQSVPGFWVGTTSILIFAVLLRWVPVSGTGSPAHLILPTLTLASYFAARIARLVRSEMLDVISQDHVRTARAKGLSEVLVLRRHVLRNALLPVVTLIGIDFGLLLGGAIVTETIFAWPGVARMTYMAIVDKDLPLVQTTVLFFGVVFVVINLLVDALYVLLDPRVAR